MVSDFLEGAVDIPVFKIKHHAYFEVNCYFSAIVETRRLTLA